MAQDPRHPPSSYDTRYPYNRVMVTESGHEFHWDDTPGAERVRIAHMSGSYTEWSHDGRRVDLVTGNHSHYIKGGYTLTVDTNTDAKHGGSVRESISGDHHSEVNGDRTTALNGSEKMTVGGDHVMAIRGDHVMGVAGSTTLKIGSEMNVKGDTHSTVYVGDTLTVEAGSSIVLKVGGSTITITGGNITVKADRIDLNP